MSTESLNRTSNIEIPEKRRVIRMSPRKVNIDVLKKRVFEEKKRERFQNRVMMGMCCLSLAILGYAIV